MSFDFRLIVNVKNKSVSSTAIVLDLIDASENEAYHRLSVFSLVCCSVR